MTASIVVNTYNRARSLERLLPSLQHLDEDLFEVVVVNGPSTDDTEAVLAQYRDRIKIARCSSANLSRSRNVGIAAAAGDVVVFIDDDALPAQTTWLRRLVDAFERDTPGRIGAAGGAALHGDTEWTEFAGGWTSDYAEQRFSDEPRSADADPSRWCRRTVGNNSAFRRTALVEIGGFDEHFPYYLDEADVCLRLVRAGYEVVYLPDAPVRHYPASSPVGPPFIRNRRLIARSDTYYCLKNGADPLPRRVFETLRRAPRKHFVQELPRLVQEGRITRPDLWRLRWHWILGVVEGLCLGLVSSRATNATSAPAPPFVPFQQLDRVRPLSIALLSRRIPPDPHSGGVGRYTYDLARGLHERGHRVTVITESDVALRHHALGFDIVGLRAAGVPAGYSQTPVLAQNLAYAEAALASVRARATTGEPFDVVHASNWGLEALGLAQWGGCPLTLMLVTPLERVIDAEGWSLTQDLLANVELDQWIIERATRVCAPSLGVLDCYSSRSGWSGRAVHPVALGTVPALPRPRRPGPRRLLFVGRHERRKGIHVLLDVLPRLLQRHEAWQCDLVGDNSLPAGPGTTFESRFREAHAGAAWLDRVVFHGPVGEADLQACYADADVFVAPSLYESFGLIYLEAMQHGVPVVATNVGGVPDVVSHDADGLLVTPGDPAALESALDRLMSDEPLRARLGARAAESVKTTHSYIALADRMVVEYRAAIAAHAVAFASDERAIAETPSVAAEALAVLDTCESTRGLSLGHRASAAFEQGRHDVAADLIAQALTVTGHPDYYAMAVELALADGDRRRAADFAARGFEVTRDASDACLVFVATLMRDGRRDRQADAWTAWQREHGARLPERFLASALTAIRTSRDGTAIVLLEACRDAGSTDRRLLAQVHYHLGSALKRRGQLADAYPCLETAARDFALLPPPLQAALHFHLGDLDLMAGRAARAIEHFEACLASNPGHGRARALLHEAVAASAAA